MKKNNLKLFLSISIIFTFLFSNSYSEIIILSKCDHRKDKFLKNEYILNLNELVMTRNYVYNEKTYQKYRKTDLSVKKSNTYVRNIYEEDGEIELYRMSSSLYSELISETVYRLDDYLITNDLIDFDEGEESDEDEDFDEFELKNMESKRKAATAIMELAKNNAIRAYVVRDGGIKAITSLVGYEDEHLRSICATTLFVLSQHEETHEKMIEDDGIEALVTLLESEVQQTMY